MKGRSQCLYHSWAGVTNNNFYSIILRSWDAHFSFQVGELVFFLHHPEHTILLSVVEESRIFIITITVHWHFHQISIFLSLVCVPPSCYSLFSQPHPLSPHWSVIQYLHFLCSERSVRHVHTYEQEYKNGVFILNTSYVCSGTLTD